MRAWWLVTTALALGGCTELAHGPSVAGYPGLQYQIESFYSARALEENATCTQPRMTISAYKVVEETPERLVLEVRYHYVDEGRRDFDRGAIDGAMFGVPGVGGQCDAFATRTFVIAKAVGGAGSGRPTAMVASMTGPQRELPPDSALR
jgi:hypothetical protein